MSSFPPTGANMRASIQLRTAAKVAPIKQSTPAPVGSLEQYESDAGSAYGFQDIAYWGAVIVLSIFTVAVIAGCAGYVSVTFF